jgi:Ca2+/Na+ antiporter
MEKLFARNALIVVLSLTVISPLFWAFFEGSLSFIIYLFGLFVLWVIFLMRTARKIDKQE